MIIKLDMYFLPDLDLSSSRRIWWGPACPESGTWWSSSSSTSVSSPPSPSTSLSSWGSLSSNRCPHPQVSQKLQFELDIMIRDSCFNNILQSYHRSPHGHYSYCWDQEEVREEDTAGVCLHHPVSSHRFASWWLLILSSATPCFSSSLWVWPHVWLQHWRVSKVSSWQLSASVGWETIFVFGSDRNSRNAIIRPFVWFKFV